MKAFEKSFNLIPISVCKYLFRLHLLKRFLFLLLKRIRTLCVNKGSVKKKAFLDLRHIEKCGF